MQVCGTQISKEYFRKRGDSNVLEAVHPCDICLEPGTLTVLCGKSGSGKSTLLNMLSGMLCPTKGTVAYDHEDLYIMADANLSRFRNRSIGYIPQGRSMVAAWNVLENVMMPLTLYRERDENRAMELLERFSIAELRDQKMAKLSGGELKRAAIARALIRDPEVIFVDEPTGDLDEENTRIVFGALQELAREGKTVLAVTHEEEAKAYADRVLLMESGRLM
jgi:putative ABC transport system ATP-binding protein